MHFLALKCSLFEFLIWYLYLKIEFYWNFTVVWALSSDLYGCFLLSVKLGKDGTSGQGHRLSHVLATQIQLSRRPLHRRRNIVRETQSPAPSVPFTSSLPLDRSLVPRRYPVNAVEWMFLPLTSVLSATQVLKTLQLNHDVSRIWVYEQALLSFHLSLRTHIFQFYNGKLCPCIHLWNEEIEKDL